MRNCSPRRYLSECTKIPFGVVVALRHLPPSRGVERWASGAAGHGSAADAGSRRLQAMVRPLRRCAAVQRQGTAPSRLPMHWAVPREGSGHGVPPWHLRMCHHHMAFRRCGEPIIIYICPQRRRDILEQRLAARVVHHRRDVAGYREEYVEIPQHVFFDGWIPERIGRETNVDLTEP